jgi:hypothetical protein
MGQLHIFPGLRENFDALCHPAVCFGLEVQGLNRSFRKLFGDVEPEGSAVVQPSGLLHGSWPAMLHQHEGVRYRFEADFDPALGWLPRTIWRTPEVSPNSQIGGPEAFRETLRNLEFGHFRDALTGQMRLFPVRSHLDAQPLAVEITVRQVAINEPLPADAFALRAEPGTEVSMSPERAGQEGRRYVEGGGEIQEALVKQAANSIRGDSGIVHDASPRQNRWYHWLGWFSGTVLLLALRARVAGKRTSGNR